MSTDKRKFAISAIATFIVLFASVNGQGNNLRHADPDPKRVDAKEGEEITVICRYPTNLLTCRFNIPGETADIKLNPTWAPRTDNYRYSGTSLEAGECGITILRAQESNHGNATCTMDPNDGLADVVGTFEIIIAKAPSPPIIKIEHDPQEADAEIEAECSAVDGRPAAEIAWFVGDQPLGPGISEVVQSFQGEASFFATISRISYRLKTEDHTKPLICRATHIAYPGGFSDSSHQLVVNYRPVPQAEFVVSGLVVGETTNIGPIQIQANPRPSVRWTVDGTVIDEGQQVDRYTAREPLQVAVGTWNVTLTISQLTLQDTTRSYKLRANNEFGTTDYNIRIGSSSDVGSSGLSIVSIIVISIISILVLVVVVLVVVARITKRWCFAGDSMHPNCPDSEAQIAPEDDKTHEHYEQHEKSAEDEPEADTVVDGGEVIKATNGKAKGNTSV